MIRKVAGKQRVGIVGICNPLIDLTVEVKDQKYLEKYEIKAGNAILAEKPIH